MERNSNEPSSGKELDNAEPCPKRPPWKNYFMSIAKLVATRSTCLRRKVGAVIVKEKRILTTGYNGAPSGLKHCSEIPEGCLRAAKGIPSGQRHELCRALHAEQNAIVQAAAFGISLRGAEIYCTDRPCVTCAKMIINSGIQKVFFSGDYPDSLAVEILQEGKISLEKVQVDD